jgi:predicted RNase H-like HicB family nuclease
MERYQYTVVIEPDEDAYHAFVPALPGCHTFGATVEEARTNILEAMELHVEAMLEDGEPIPIEREPLFITRLTIPVPA